MQASQDDLDVTVVLPVRNEAAHIETILRDVLDQDLGDLEIEVLVVDGDSDDTTVALVEAIAAEDGRVRALHNRRRLSSAARALGAEEARGTYVLYVDGHCRIPSRTLVRDMVDLFERKGADCLARPQRLQTGDPGYWARAIAAARTSPFGHSLASTIYDESEREVSPVSAGAMYRKAVFEQVGNYDPDFDACEDVEFNWRVEKAGLSCWTSPALALLYEPRRTLRGLFRQMHRYGLGRARLHRKHREAFTLECLVPAAFTAGLPVAAVLTPLVGPWALAPYAAYVAASLAISGLTAARTSWSLFPALPPTFFATHTGFGVGYLRGLSSRRPGSA